MNSAIHHFRVSGSTRDRIAFAFEVGAGLKETGIDNCPHVTMDDYGVPEAEVAQFKRTAEIYNITVWEVSR